MYLDYDICAEVKDQDCRSSDQDTRAMLEEFCPEQCSCRKLQLASLKFIFNFSLTDDSVDGDEVKDSELSKADN